MQTTAGGATTPIISLYATATVSPRVVEIGVTNTTTTAVALLVARITTGNNKGTNLTEAEYNQDWQPPLGTAFGTHSGVETVADLGYRAQLGAASGSGMIWTFGDGGLVIPPGTTNAIGVVTVGTGQVCQAYIVWDE